MQTLIFITVVVVFVAMTIKKSKGSEKRINTEISTLLPSNSTGYDDEKIFTLTYNFGKSADIIELGVAIQGQIEDELSKLLCSGHVCRVEFIPVGYNLLVVIRAKIDVNSVRRKGGLRLWQKQ